MVPLYLVRLKSSSEYIEPYMTWFSKGVPHENDEVMDGCSVKRQELMRRTRFLSRLCSLQVAPRRASRIGKISL